MNRWSVQHELIEGLFRAGLAAVEPRSAVAGAMSLDGSSLRVAGKPVELKGRVVVLAIGKAAATMALGAIDVLGDRIDVGIALTKDDHFDVDIPGFECHEARHPLPDQRGIHATRRILEVVSDLGSSDVVLALISGGGSALLESPTGGITLEEFQQTTQLLLHAGAPIQDLNAVRSAISDVKGGGLRRSIGDATCISLILSDVLGNNPKVIASGPTIPGLIDNSAARDVIDRYELADRIPDSVRDALDRMIKQVLVEAKDDVWTIVGDNRIMLEAVAASAKDSGLQSEITWRNHEGEARELGKQFAHLAANTPVETDILIGGGEATVTVTGKGNGGRNTEFALAAAIELDERHNRDWVISSLGSDGEDGSADAAGAIADPDSVTRASARGVSALDHLRDNDSASFFRATGGLVRPGPTGTNVNDLYLAVRVK